MVTNTVGPVRILTGALDETPQREIVLRGVIDQDNLRNLQVDDYQREANPLTALSSILEALKSGETLPDIELGMRGEKYVDKDGVLTLKDSVYIIDGLQRVNAAMHFLAQNPNAKVRLGAMIHFGTTKEWERDRFRILNTLRNKVSPNIILRNKKEESPVVAMLYTLSNSDKTFPMNERISWSQRMARSELISALSLAKVMGSLHSHKSGGRSTGVDELVRALDRSVEVYGIQNLRSNTRTFFDLIDGCWGIKRIQYKEGASYIKANFLIVLARLVSDHHDFWRQPDEKVLLIEPSLRRKIALFPIQDPQIINLASSGGKSRDMLYMLIRDHVNSGKRSKRLRSRHGDMVLLNDTDDDNGNGEK